jgi:hypothetical protein
MVWLCNILISSNLKQDCIPECICLITSWSDSEQSQWKQHTPQWVWWMQCGRFFGICYRWVVSNCHYSIWSQLLCTLILSPKDRLGEYTSSAHPGGDCYGTASIWCSKLCFSAAGHSSSAILISTIPTRDTVRKWTVFRHILSDLWTRESYKIAAECFLKTVFWLCFLAKKALTASLLHL